MTQKAPYNPFKDPVKKSKEQLKRDVAASVRKFRHELKLRGGSYLSPTDLCPEAAQALKFILPTVNNSKRRAVECALILLAENIKKVIAANQAKDKPAEHKIVVE